MKIEIDNYHALCLMDFLMEFESDFKDKEECTTIRKAIEEFTGKVCNNLSEEELYGTIDNNLTADRLLGWVPNNNRK